VISLLATLLLAQPIPLHYMPAGHPYSIEAVGEVRYFLFDEYKLLLKLDNDLFTARQELELQRALNTDLADLLDIEKSRSESYRNSSDLYRQQSERLNQNWMKCERDLAKEVGWDLASILVGAGSGLLLGVLAGVVIALAT
jgi:hypothetical protein